MNHPLISICIPVYNVEKYLCECLDSIVNQTLCNIEIICVNDGSTDRSLDILESYKIKDSRIKLISFATNKSVLQARKVAVEVATAPFIMFVDSDDSLELDACEKLYSYIKEYDVDILHFGTFVDATNEVRSDVIKWFEDFAEPYQQKVYDEDILTFCFKDKKIIWNLWNKIYKAEVCKLAFSKIGSLYLNMCEDMYTFFIIAFYASSYLGVNEKFYHYRFGAGITGKRQVWDDKRVNDLCHMAYVVPLLKKLVSSKKQCKFYEDIFDGFNRDFLNAALSGLSNLSSEANKVRCMELYCSRFGERSAYDCVVTRLNNQEEAILNLSRQLHEREQVITNLSNQLHECEEVILNHSNKLYEYEQVVAKLTQQLKVAAQEIIKLNSDINGLNKQIYGIQNTRGYKLLELLRKIKRKLTLK